MFVVMYLIIYGYWVFSGSGLLDVHGKPIGGDFVGYWAASQIVLSGHPADVYNQEKLYPVEQNITGTPYLLPINYPPTYLLMIAPISLLPYLLSLIIWLAITFLLYLIIICRIAPDRAAIWLAIAFPGTFQNIIHGNNGFLSTILLGGGLLWMKRFPFAGGILFGLLTYKPHLAILIPVVLIAGRCWKTLAGMITSTASLIIISCLIFGKEIWVAFLKNIPLAFKILETSVLPLFQMPTTFAATLLAGGHPLTAEILHGTVAAATLAITISVWLQNGPIFLRASSLSIGILLLTPHACTHDLAILSLPLAWIGWQIYTEHWPPEETIMPAICWISPLICVPLASLTKIQIMPFIMVAFLLFILRMKKRYTANRLERYA